MSIRGRSSPALDQAGMRALRAAQAARFAGLDPLLPSITLDPEAPDGPNAVDERELTAALPSGHRVAGTIVHTVHGPGTPTSLWSARNTWELFPLVGEEAGAGIDALLRAWRRLMDSAIGAPDDDSACLVTWPSRDPMGGQAMLRHGFVPLSVLAVRTGSPEPADPAGLVIRRATLRDLDVAVQLGLAEMAYSVMVGNTVPRPDAARIRRESLGRRIAGGDPIYLAERDGVPVALADCWLTESQPGVRRRFPVPEGRWGYVNVASVLPGARGAGVGRALMAVVHQELRRAGAIGTYLYYNPPNPLSSVFWPRQGYRPLWTIWETRPASALR